MKLVVDSNGQEIGHFDGRFVKDKTGKSIYWISDGEVFELSEHTDTDLISFNKGLFVLIGLYSEGQCLADGKMIFQIQK